MKKVLAIFLALVLCLSVSGALAADKVGVSMPTQSLQRWNQDGANLKAKLEEAGFEVDLQYANDQVPLQVSQLEGMIAGGVKILFISAIEANSLGTVLAEAKAKGVTVIAYDRLIRDTDAVNYYVTFDNYKVGTLQGTYIEQVLGLKDGKGPYNVEFTAGDPGDNNAGFFFNGAMDLLKPYIESGKLVIPSGQTAFEQVATPTWKSDVAQARFEGILASFYAGGTKLDAVVCSNDSTAFGVETALEGAGYTLDNWPYITGQDCDIANTKNIIAGKQSMSVFKDTRDLAKQAVAMAVAISKGEKPEVNDTTTYDNGVFIVPTYLCNPVFADINNYKTLLIESGYYTEDQLK
jgi:putative multiple sugar transport system substrate-binding protein